MHAGGDGNMMAGRWVGGSDSSSRHEPHDTEGCTGTGSHRQHPSRSEPEPRPSRDLQLPGEQQNASRRGVPHRLISKTQSELIRAARNIGRGRRRRLRGWGSSVAALSSIFLIFLSFSLTVGEHDDDLGSLRLELADLLQDRKLLNGESTYPARYKSVYKPDLEECSGDACVECRGEVLENLQAVKFFLEREITTLEALGCPCDILSAEPNIGSFRGGTAVRLTVTGLDLTRACNQGPVSCWVRRDLEDYAVVPATRVGESVIECVTPAMDRPFLSQITLHAPTWVLVSSSTDSDQFLFFDVEAASLAGVYPTAVPSSGGALLTLSGEGFPLDLPVSCYFRGIAFEATVVNSSFATCTTPALPEEDGNVQLTVNGVDTIGGEGVPLVVYTQPRIFGIWPNEGFGGEQLFINAGGLGLRYQPLPEDLLCRFKLPDANVTVAAARLGNSSTITCTVPNNTRGIHPLSGFVPVEVSLLGDRDELFTDQGEAGPNRFLYRCVDRQTRYGTLVDFFPQCTADMCCPAGYVSNATHCVKCPEATYSFAGAAACLPCPANSWSPAGSPSPESCVCEDGWVGSANGLLELPSDSCRTCGADEVGFTAIERREEAFVTRTVHTLGVYGLAASCAPCPRFSRAPANSNHPADCQCGVGYLCVAQGVPCYQRLLSAVVAWSQRQCAVPLTALPTDFFDAPRCSAVASSGVASALCDPCAGGAPVCACTCSGSPGFAPNSTVGECQDVDECALGTASCPAGQVCINEAGGVPGYSCGCADGYELGQLSECRDVDECSAGTHGCHPNADCSNAEGSFACSCKRGYHGDGVVDCWDGDFECAGAVEVAVSTMNGTRCWGVPNSTAQVGPPGDFYCDQDAGTRGAVLLRLFWLESQQWSQELRLDAGGGWNLSAGYASGPQIVAELPWTETPAMVQYRVEGSDAWHPRSISVRLYNGEWTYRTLGDLCWVDIDSCNEKGCFAQSAEGCSEVRASSVVDFDECALGAHRCDANAACANRVGGYDCQCNAGYYGEGQSALGPGTECSPCPGGSYAAAGATSCEVCPDPAFSHSDPGSALAGCQCRAGYYGNLSVPNATCVMCELDNYCPGDSRELPCPANSGSPRATGERADCVCNAGYYGDNGGPCRVCPPGSTCVGGWVQPAPCPDGNYSTAGQTECQSCPAASGSEGGDPRCSCGPGLFDSAYFQEVTAGTCYDAGCSPVRSAGECRAGADLLGLSVGSFDPSAGGDGGCAFAAGSSALTFAPGGVPEATECSSASACVCGMCNPAVCDDCAAGKYSEAGAFDCIDCPANADSAAGSAFTGCGCVEGFYGILEQPGDNCSSCPPQATSEFGARRFEECHCLPGYAGNTTEPLGPEDCGGTTVSGAACVFPFRFNGVEYSSCTRAVAPTWTVVGGVNGTVLFDGADAPWCATGAVPSAGTAVETSAPFLGNRTDWWDYCACSHCVVCEPGSFSSGRQNECAQCPEGSYSDRSAASACASCPAYATSPAGSDSVWDCYCQPGFRNDSGVCVNVLECSVGADDCDANATCADTFGSFTCTCNAGFVGDGTNGSCALCAAGFECPGGNTTAMCAQTTYAPPGSASCQGCPTAADSPSGSGNVTDCVCNAGYLGPILQVGDVCADVDECLSPRDVSTDPLGHTCHVPGADCTNSVGSFSCACQLGWNGDGVNCSAVCGDGYNTVVEGCDDGDTVPGDGCDELCEVEPGYNCTPALQNSVCSDLDECGLGTHNCDGNAACTNTVGSFTCACDADFFGSGVRCLACTYGSESAAGSTLPQNCSCSLGFRLIPNASEAVLDSAGNASGFETHLCEDIQECEEGFHNCDPYATCANSQGSFACACPRIGFVDTSNGTGVACEDIDECLIVPSNAMPPTSSSSTSVPPTTSPVPLNTTAASGSTSSTASAVTSSATNTTAVPGTTSSSMPLSSTSAAPTTTMATTTPAPAIVYGQNCDENAECRNVPGSFECACLAGFADASGVLGIGRGSVGACGVCPEDTYATANSSACVACPPNAVAPNASTGFANCSCAPGYAGLAGSGVGNCTMCLSGTYSPGGVAACLRCEPNSYSGNGSTDISACVCDAGYYLEGAECVACPIFATSAVDSRREADCVCKPGWYDEGESDALLNCTRCPPCPAGQRRYACEENDRGFCANLDECAVGLDTCDAVNGACADTDGSFACACNAGYYGNGSTCWKCTKNAHSPDASTRVSNCSCNAGYDTGDGETRRIFESDELCLASVEIRIDVAGGAMNAVASGQANGTNATNATTLPAGCWSTGSAEYCDENAGTEEDVWVRLQWAEGTYTEWYALYSTGAVEFHGIRDLSMGFSFEAGGTVVALLTRMQHVGGAPVLVEYSVDGEDAFRPARIQVRFTSGGIPELGLDNVTYSTAGELCWVDGDGMGSEQLRLGCAEVGRSATATLFEPPPPPAGPNATAAEQDSETEVGTLRRRQTEGKGAVEGTEAGLRGGLRGDREAR